MWLRLLLPLLVLFLPALALGALVPPGGGQPVPADSLPEPLRLLAAWAFALQRQLTGEMRQNLAVLKESGSWEPAAAIMTAAFLYGVFHAVGPGHGKVVIAGWFATRRARILHGLTASFIAAMVQALSAIVAVLALAGVLALAPAKVMAGAAWLEAVSFALIAGIGAVMVWRTWTDRGCGHEHGHTDGHAGGHDHGHHGCCDHAHHTKEAEPGERNALFATAAAVGLRPCSGAILVLLFCLANDILAVGIMATFAMGLGVCLTVAALGLGALGLNRLLERVFGESTQGARIRKGLALAGALGITGLGLILLLGVLVNGPSLGS